MITHAFTCTGPYAVLVMLGIKRVENRSVLPVPGKVVGCCDYAARLESAPYHGVSREVWT